MKCCKKDIKAKRFGFGWVAVCPICKRVVYNSKTKKKWEPKLEPTIRTGISKEVIKNATSPRGNFTRTCSTF